MNERTNDADTDDAESDDVPSFEGQVVFKGDFDDPDDEHDD